MSQNADPYFTKVNIDYNANKPWSGQFESQFSKGPFTAAADYHYAQYRDGGGDPTKKVAAYHWEQKAAEEAERKKQAALYGLGLSPEQYAQEQMQANEQKRMRQNKEWEAIQGWNLNAAQRAREDELRGQSLAAEQAKRDAEYRAQLQMLQTRQQPLVQYMSSNRTQNPGMMDLSALLEFYKGTGGNAQNNMQRNWQTIASILGR